MDKLNNLKCELVAKEVSYEADVGNCDGIGEALLTAMVGIAVTMGILVGILANLG